MEGRAGVLLRDHVGLDVAFDLDDLAQALEVALLARDVHRGPLLAHTLVDDGGVGGEERFDAARVARRGREVEREELLAVAVLERLQRGGWRR